MGITGAGCGERFAALTLRAAVGGPKRRRFVEPCRGFSPLSAVRHAKKKAWTRIQAFSLNLAVREGLIRCAHPAGRRWRSKTQAFCRTLSRLLAPLGGAPCKKKAWTRIQAFSSNLAVREGFEPSIHFRVYTLSRRAPSATQTPHRFVIDNALRCRRALM